MNADIDPMHIMPANVEAAIEQAIDDMERLPIGGGSPLLDGPVGIIAESGMIEEKTLRNGHMVREEVRETPGHKVIKVTEEGPDARNAANEKEVKDELTKQFKQLQSTLQPGPGEAMRVHEETGANA